MVMLFDPAGSPRICRSGYQCMTTDVVWGSISPIKASVWSRYLPESSKRIADRAGS
jgi:hypothetical protein